MQEYINKRKSVRKFEMETLSDDCLLQINDFIKTIIPLNSTINYEYHLVNKEDTKSLIPIKAPHYLLLYSEDKEGYLENIGFIFQQLDIFLSSIGLGCCWLGMAKPISNKHSELEFVITLAFGKALDTPYRTLNEFKRKALHQISNTSDTRLECARLAPSATNSQPWYFVTNDTNIDVYCVKSSLIKGFIFNKMNKIDMGIALAHLYLCNKDEFKYFKQEVKDIKGYYYIGSINIA